MSNTLPKASDGAEPAQADGGNGWGAKFKAWAKPLAIGTAVGATVAFGVPLAVTAFGFTSAGVAAGSLAAAWQSTMGGYVAAGSLFATLQSLGATGAIVTLATSSGMALGAAATLLIKYLQSYNVETATAEDANKVVSAVEGFLSRAESANVAQGVLQEIRDLLRDIRRKLEQKSSVEKSDL